MRRFFAGASPEEGEESVGGAAFTGNEWHASGPSGDGTPPAEELPSSDASLKAPTEPVPPAPSEEEAPSSPGTGDHASTFSTLEEHDRVVVMLLFDQVVRVKEVGAAWDYRRKAGAGAPDTLWRAVARLPCVDAEAVFETAARVYAFEPLDFNMYGARALVRKRRRTFSVDQWRRMIDLNVAPVSTEYDEEKGVRWIFATHDPARPAVQMLLADLDVQNHTLHYAPRTPIEQVFDEALPRLARDRSRPRPLPQAVTGQAAEDVRRRFLNNSALGSVASTALLEVEDDPRAQDAKGTAGEAPSEALPRPSAFFDDVLTGAVQNGARAVCLVGNERGELDVYHYKDRNVDHWQAEARLSAEAMIDFVSGYIRSLRPAGDPSDGAVERWVAGRRVEFKPSIAPAHRLPEAIPAQSGTEVIVIELLR